MSECINPAEIREGDLMAYVDGEANEGVADHIRRCPFCAERVRAYRRLQGALVAAAYRASCPSPETLGDFHLNALPPGQKLVVASHLRQCPHCARELEAYAASADEDAPAGWAERLQGTIMGVIEAVLVPSRPQPAGVRGRGARQQLYQADDLSILVGFEASPGRPGTLSGVIIPTGQCRSSLPGTQVGLFQEGEIVGTESLNELGHFVFQGISPGDYGLTFDWRGRMVLMPRVEAR